MHINTPITA